MHASEIRILFVFCVLFFIIFFIFLGLGGGGGGMLCFIYVVSDVFVVDHCHCLSSAAGMVL